MNLNDLTEQYIDSIKTVRKNRKKVKDLLSENREKRSDVERLKQEIKSIISKEMKSGKSLYKICMERFGKIDNRYHVLYSVLGTRKRRGTK